MTLCSAVENYIASAKGLPFFYAVGDDNYKETLNELKQRGLIVDRISDFCPKDDKFPSIDEIIDYFRTLDVDCRQNRHVLVGLGEYLALKGSTAAEKELRRLKNVTLGSARVILLLRCVTPQIYALTNEDNRLMEQQRVFFGEKTFSDLSVSSINYWMKNDICNGVKGLLRAFEDGKSGNCYVNTALTFPNSLLPVSSINTAFSAIKQLVPHFNLKEEWGTEVQWDHLLRELSRNKNSLDRVFERQGFSDDFEYELYQNCTGFEFKNWLFFLYLKQNIDNISSGYLRYILSVTDNYENLKANILTGIIRVLRTDKRFSTFYVERKKLIKNFPETDIAIFIHENCIDPMESIYRFTDNTQIEREAIIRWIADNGYISDINNIYPDLGQYLQDYVFDCGKLSEELTSYFKEYKIQKVTNRIRPEFLERVIDNAHKLQYMHLETRDSAILRIEDKKSAFLYWIDALGVEYLSYITSLVKKKGLSMHVDIAYSELPTITSINRGFFEQWPTSKKQKEEALDEIKHKTKGGYFFDKCEAPIHLAAELKVIERAIDLAATELAMHKCKSFIIASDHGASRLAVIHRQEEKYETDTKGEHSGRCCKTFPGAELSYAVEENGYLVLTNYGRFKKSRAANVEVHGGASLEEVLVPIITLTLRKQSDLVIKLLGEDKIYADRHAGTEITLYISDVENTENVSIIIGENRYCAVCKDSTHFIVALEDIKRAKCNISASIFDGDDLIGNIKFDIKSKTATVKSDFDDLF